MWHQQSHHGDNTGNRAQPGLPRGPPQPPSGSLLPAVAPHAPFCSFLPSSASSHGNERRMGREMASRCSPPPASGCGQSCSAGGGDTVALGRLFWGVTFVPQSQQLPVLGTGVSGMPPGCN